MPARRTDLVVEPLTPDRWPAFEELMDAGGPAGRCWCMAYRVGPGYRRRPADQNREDMHGVVRRGPPPGLLAFDAEGVAVGWCQVTPRADVPAIGRQWRLRPVDDMPVWAITCFYVRKGRRRAGVMGALVDAAVDLARRAGAPAVEAYPLDATRSPSATSTGYAATFAAAGFVEVARRSPERPVMRLALTTPR
ncbi:GNAT family N-acetyltransferase [Cellulomonas sp.]|uniref:GNAT family N-acetyltransferase n=1 Tax=Cellulomonas sp. TaxID=40001 RepID=UPI001B1BF4FE|nr:GNAT family N-acetyltransferase [Cellulomonas sp.]MBO9553880.1 GNAT family N-acetyltransferase [Cellulomonas sp.]